ncbi:unnamed protein product [Closterium sp. Naga37s-1]|nr:unnamed protein product [Closterium sp. Naga37s-1]
MCTARHVTSLPCHRHACAYRVQGEFCDQLWDVMGAARFWFTKTDAYFLPSLYYVPSFAARLNELFPDGRIYTHVARYLLHPDNQLWGTITAAFHANLTRFSHRLGVQVRMACRRFL